MKTYETLEAQFRNIVEWMDDEMTDTCFKLDEMTNESDLEGYVANILERMSEAKMELKAVYHELLLKKAVGL